MEAYKIMIIIQIVAFIQGYDNFIATEHLKVNVKDGHSGCSWTLSSSRDNMVISVITVEDIYNLSSQICLSLGCGDVYKLKASDAEFNSTCLTGCLYHNSELKNCSQIVRSNCKMLFEVICGFPYVALISSPCSWTIKSPDAESPVSLTEDIVRSVSREICHNLGCGQIYSLAQSSMELNTTCFTNCVYHNNQLKNCTPIVNSNCSTISKVICGNDAVRLVGGGHRCGGRVEVWQGSWGTVCDDGWDMEDANVVCSQLGCGHAVSVSGNGEPYGKGSGPIHLDELNCSGIEKSLWECPALTQEHDCGHKEDAGVVCSEYKALRLTGGLDRCSGRVEFHRNGRWGTVCDTSWHKEEATMACDMLNCGMVEHFTPFDPPFKHTNESLWYINCAKNNTNLWQCQEYIDNPYLCSETKAAGLICKNSLGLPVPTSQKPPSTPATTDITRMDNSHGLFLSPELLGCFVLGFFLLVAVIANILLCHHDRKKKAVCKIANVQTTEVKENNYGDSIHLVKLTNNNSNAEEVSVVPQRVWPQSSVESGSYDTDYEHHDISPEVVLSLSTFQNSMRYSTEGKTPNLKTTNLNRVTEEVNSFESSCTSSEECYENTKENGDSLQTPDNENIPTQEYPESGSFLGHTMDPPFSYQDEVGGSGEDSPLYSPVSYDNEAVSSESDYDDIGNYIQQPSHLH